MSKRIRLGLVSRKISLAVFLCGVFSLVFLITAMLSLPALVFAAGPVPISPANNATGV